MFNLFIGEVYGLTIQVCLSTGTIKKKVKSNCLTGYNNKTLFLTVYIGPKT